MKTNIKESIVDKIRFITVLNIIFYWQAARFMEQIERWPAQRDGVGAQPIYNCNPSRDPIGATRK